MSLIGSVGREKQLWLPLDPAHASVSPAEGGAAGGALPDGEAPKRKGAVTFSYGHTHTSQYRINKAIFFSHPFLGP